MKVNSRLLFFIFLIIYNPINFNTVLEEQIEEIEIGLEAEGEEFEKLKEEIEEELGKHSHIGSEGAEILLSPMPPSKEAGICDFERIISKATSVKEHSPNMVCCYSLKLYAHWLLQVAQNSQGWCKWITDIIGQIRLYAAILRGEVRQPNGTLRIMYKEEWDQFKTQLEADTVAFRQYNAHVKDLSKNIITQFTGKRIACCPVCLETKQIFSVENGHEVLSQLVEAVKTADYWRRWLENLVLYATNIKRMEISMSFLCCLFIRDIFFFAEHLPPCPSNMSIESVSIRAPSMESSIYDLLSVATSGSSGSFMIIEDLSPKKLRQPCRSERL